LRFLRHIYSYEKSNGAPQATDLIEKAESKSKADIELSKQIKISFTAPE